jgi:replication-associated recombination protein RarA
MEYVSVSKLNTDVYEKTHGILDRFVTGNRMSVLYYGRKGTGKSTFILNLETEFPDYECEFLYIDALDVYSAYKFFRILAEELNYYPVETKYWEDYAGAILDYMKEQDKKFVIAVDHVGSLNSVRDNIMEHLRDLYTEAGNIIFMFAIDKVNKKVFDIKHPFYGQLVYVQFKELDKEKIKLFIDTTKPDKEYNLTNGNLQLIRILKDLIMINNNRQGKRVEAVYKNIFNTIISFSPQKRAILLALLDDDKTASEISSEIDSRITSVFKQLQELLEDGYVNILNDEKKYSVPEFIKTNLL